ncbi:MAG TPA: acetolactate synthase small subunit [Symbiobacteriaceae bacterium]|nr:acetolactate synthase small subunit [Symbiobacteriaceae bacterium]
MKQILAVLVENQPGVLARVAGLIRRRGFNIDSLAVGTTADPAISRITLVVDGDEPQIQQVMRQLEKLIEVLAVSELAEGASVARELALIKVTATPESRPQLLQLAAVFRANVVDVAKGAIMIEVTGNQEKVDALIAVTREYGIQEVVRTGVIALGRGTQSAIPSFIQEDDTHDAYVLRG